KTEEFNQKDAYAIFYYLSKKAGMSHEDALRSAYLNGNVLSMFAYNQANQPVYLRNPLAKTLFQYSRFTASSVGLTSAALTAGGFDKILRIPGQGKSTFGGVSRWVLSTFLIGGLRGLPLIPTPLLGVLYERIREGLGDDPDAKLLAEVIMNGIP